MSVLLITHPHLLHVKHTSSQHPFYFFLLRSQLVDPLESMYKYSQMNLVDKQIEGTQLLYFGTHCAAIASEHPKTTPLSVQGVHSVYFLASTYLLQTNCEAGLRCGH